MRVWEAIAMLEQMDKTKECTVTFGEAKQAKPFSGIPYPRDYVIGKEQWPSSWNPDSQKDSLVKKNVH
jgi:hypothetical protein